MLALARRCHATAASLAALTRTLLREVTGRRHRPDGAERGIDLRKTPPLDLSVTWRALP